MNTDYGFSKNFLNKYDFGGYSTGQFSYDSAKYAKIENADITIITDDGDRVTISSDTIMESSYASYSGLLRSGSSSLKAEGYEYQSQQRNKFSMSIVGDLDSQEYDDIISALDTIDSFMKGAFSVNTEDLQAAAEKFGGLDSLSSLSATVQIKEAINYEQVEFVVSEVNDPAVETAKDLKNFDKLDNALASILNAGKRHGKVPGSVKHHLDGYLSGMLDSFSKKSEKKNNREAVELIKDLIMSRLAEKSNEEENITDDTQAETI